MRNFLLSALFLFLLSIVTGFDNRSKKINLSFTAIPENEEGLFHASLVNKFYEMNDGKFLWFTADAEAFSLREELSALIDTSFYYGLIERAYHITDIKANSKGLFSDSLVMLTTERIYTDAAIAVFKDLYQGYKMKPWVGFDQVSAKYSESDDEYLLKCLFYIRSADQLKTTASRLEPDDVNYRAMKKELKRQKGKNRKDSAAAVLLSMNYYRWIHHFNFDKLIVVNLPAARLHYFEKDSLVLNMKTVLGKSSTPTPRFAAWCDQVILYPYWYVPRSITFNEYLPVIRKNPSWLDAKNMQVIDGSGKVINHHTLNWSLFHTGYFPYTIRQSTGCDNALGVIKFNINTPYGVYLHDTNNKTAFLSASRYFSHGCIRLEEPIDLGNRVLSNKLDTAFLQSCFREQRPIYKPLSAPVPVFVVYMPVVTDAKGKIIYYKDVYRLLK